MSKRIDRILQGDIQTAAKLITAISNDALGVLEELKELYSHVGKSYVIGVTGSPGTGKSTLVDQMIAEFRNDDKTVGVIAIDPTSPFSGGALLGDRIRMHRCASDKGVFIRSLATRGHFGGATKSTADVIRVMDALGKDIIIIETVGVGQDEVEIVSMAHTTVIVTIPGMGDEIQLMKAGFAEIGDVFAVNKADYEGVNKTVMDLEGMLKFRTHARPEESWNPVIFKTIATSGVGITELVQGIYQHRASQQRADLIERQREKRIKYEFMEIAKSFALKRVEERVERSGGLEHVLKEMDQNSIDPYTMVERVFAGV